MARASKSRLRARVGVKRVQAGYLETQAKGGVRFPKGRALVVPVSARVNKYGNLPKGALARLKSKRNTFVASGSKRKTSHLKPGVYQRPAGKRNRGAPIKMQVSFKPRARYQARYQFQPVALKAARRNFEDHFFARFRAAMATAK